MEPSSLLPTRPLPLSTTSLSSLLSYFESTYALYEQLFHTINDHSAYYLKPEPLRHPLIFYLGHTAVVYINTNSFGVNGTMSRRAVSYKRIDIFIELSPEDLS